MKFEEDQIDWTVQPFETSTGEKRHPFFGPLIWDLIVTYVALNYQDDYDLLDDEYEIADILTIFSQSEDLQVLCKELNACLEAEEPESKSSDILDHMSCRSLCSVYESFRLNELIDELPKLEEYLSLDKSYQKLRESKTTDDWEWPIFADESEDSE